MNALGFMAVLTNASMITVRPRLMRTDGTDMVENGLLQPYSGVTDQKDARQAGCVGHL
jgi:hypothetical protein